MAFWIPPEGLSKYLLQDLGLEAWDDLPIRPWSPLLNLAEIGPVLVNECGR